MAKGEIKQIEIYCLEFMTILLVVLLAALTLPACGPQNQMFKIKQKIEKAILWRGFYDRKLRDAEP